MREGAGEKDTQTDRQTPGPDNGREGAGLQCRPSQLTRQFLPLPHAASHIIRQKQYTEDVTKFQERSESTHTACPVLAEFTRVHLLLHSVSSPQWGTGQQVSLGRWRKV